MKKWLGLGLALSLMLMPAPTMVRAETSLGVGFAVGVSPYRDYDTNWSFFPIIRYENDLIYVRDLSLGLKLYDTEPLELSVFLAYDPTHFTNGDSSDRRLRRLKDRREGLLVGGRADWASPVGDFHLTLGGDISGHSQGLVGRLAYSKSFQYDVFTLTPHLGLVWHSDDYNNYYYGVSNRESLVSGLRPYQADAAFAPFVGFSASLPLGDEERWRLFLSGEVQALPSEIKDSPMVDRSYTYHLGTGISYGF